MLLIRSDLRTNHTMMIVIITFTMKYSGTTGGSCDCRRDEYVVRFARLGSKHHRITFLKSSLINLLL